MLRCTVKSLKHGKRFNYYSTKSVKPNQAVSVPQSADVVVIGKFWWIPLVEFVIKNKIKNENKFARWWKCWMPYVVPIVEAGRQCGLIGAESIDCWNYMAYVGSAVAPPAKRCRRAVSRTQFLHRHLFVYFYLQ